MFFRMTLSHFNMILWSNYWESNAVLSESIYYVHLSHAWFYIIGERGWCIHWCDTTLDFWSNVAAVPKCWCSQPNQQGHLHHLQFLWDQSKQYCIPCKMSTTLLHSEINHDIKGITTSEQWGQILVHDSCIF